MKFDRNVNVDKGTEIILWLFWPVLEFQYDSGLTEMIIYASQFKF